MTDNKNQAKYILLIIFLDSPLTRRLPHHYEDGVYQPSRPNGPNPRSVSEMVMKGLTGEGSYQNKTAFLVFFGMFFFVC